MIRATVVALSFACGLAGLVTSLLSYEPSPPEPCRDQTMPNADNVCPHEQHRLVFEVPTTDRVWVMCRCAP